LEKRFAGVTAGEGVDGGGHEGGGEGWERWVKAGTGVVEVKAGSGEWVEKHLERKEGCGDGGEGGWIY
jgi:hypothetical protein